MWVNLRLKAFPVAVCLLLFLNACASRERIAPMVIETNDPVQQLISLEADLEAAREQQLDVLAPNSFAKADQFYREARQMLDREEVISDILLKTTSARVELQQAAQTSQIVRTVLADVIEVRDLALAAGAGNLEEDYAKAEDDFLKLTRAIEDNNLGWAQRHKSKSFDAFDQLELRAIKDKHLSEARKMIEISEQQKAGKIAPLTLAETREKLKNAEDFITANRYLQAEITRRAATASFYARRLNIIMRQSEELKNLTMEQIALLMEQQLHVTASQLAAPDHRDQLFPDQLESVLATIEAWEAACQELNDEVVTQQGIIDKLRVEIAALEGVTLEVREARERLAEEKKIAKKRLEEEQRFQQLLSNLQNLFEPREAEIYKQADHFVIRLKAMQFPVGSSNITSDNYPLLTKLQRAIRLFDQPKATIEGHTDGTGSEAKNRELSQGRAEAVRAYLVANETLPSEKIVAVGFGSERPLASDATAQGRAINRRIDLIITPVLPGESK